MKKGIDLAQWNIVTNYQSVKNAGVQFAILKVINASNTADKLFNTHTAGCNSAGIQIIAGYTYSYANTVEKAKKAADAFVSIGLLKGIKAMWLDLEDKSMMGLGSKIVDIINIYRAAAKAADMEFGIYTGAQFYTPCLEPYAKELTDIPIWWARYPYTKEYSVCMDMPGTGYLPQGMNISGWQYTSKCVIDGINGYADLNAWYDNEPFEKTAKEISVEYNPFTEPTANVKLGKVGNDASWVQWYLWRFGKLTDSSGQADAVQINGIYDADTAQKVKEVQSILGLPADGIVGKVTRAVWKKIC